MGGLEKLREVAWVDAFCSLLKLTNGKKTQKFSWRSLTKKDLEFILIKKCDIDYEL